MGYVGDRMILKCYFFLEDYTEVGFLGDRMMLYRVTSANEDTLFRNHIR